MSRRAELLRLTLKLLKQRSRGARVPAAAVRRRLQLIERIVPGPPRGTRTTALDADGVSAVRIDVSEARSDRYVLYFHGGGYQIGAAPLFRDFTWRIGTVTRARVLAFDYRLAPEHPFPAAVEDASTVYRWLARHVDPQHLAFVGDSAGGGLALATLCKARDDGLALPGAIVAISPWTDLALTGRSLKANAAADPMLDAASLPDLASQYLAGADPRHPYASPLYGSPCRFPPTLIQVGSDEILHDDAVRMADRLRGAGCDVEIRVWPRMPHAWHLYARILPEARQAIAEIGAFLQGRF